MIQITPRIAIDENEIQEEFTRASGPGGQNVNKVSTAVVLRFDVGQSLLPPDMKQRLIKLAGKRISTDGVLIIKGQQYRTQDKNRQDARDRLIELLQEAAIPPKTRIATKPTRGSRLRTLAEKSQRSEIKKNRRPPSVDD